MSGPRILVVDDEPAIRRVLRIALASQSYAVSEAETGRAALAAVADSGTDLVVLDLGLPDLDGLEVLRRIRLGSAVPVIVLSVRASERDKVRLLDAGANDYVTKPFGIDELLARVRTALRATMRDDDVDYDDGHLRVDLGARTVTLDRVPVLLARKELDVLATLVRERGRVVTQRRLLREHWGESHEDDTHYLRVLVGRLRQKLGDSATDPTYLHTDPGVGYRFGPD